MSLDPTEQTAKQLRQSALGLLCRREYSRHELHQRLQRQAVSSEQVETVLAQLEQQGLQSDQRFAESFVRSRIARGQGAVRIGQELRQKGVDEQVRAQVLEACEQDWFELAADVRQRRFGDALTDEPRLRAKQLRFLLYRGFTQEQAYYALEQARSCAED